MKKIHIINGPNLNLLGSRNPNIYGKISLDELKETLNRYFNGKCSLHWSQSNKEGDLIDYIQNSDQKYDAVVINPAAFSHTSIAIRDAIEAVAIPCVEVHLSNIFARENFRQTSMIAPKCVGSISGFGINSYILGVQAILLA